MDGRRLVARERTDSRTGERSIEYFGRESFIKAFSRPGQRVERIVDPTTGRVLMGAPFSQMPV